MTWILGGLIGVVAGVVSGLFGVGGAIVIVPALLLIARLPQHTANGTSLAAILLPVGILGVLEYHRRGQVHFLYAAAIALGLVLGVLLGAKLAGHVPELVLRRMFGGLLLVVAVKLIAF